MFDQKYQLEKPTDFHNQTQQCKYYFVLQPFQNLFLLPEIQFNHD